MTGGHDRIDASGSVDLVGSVNLSLRGNPTLIGNETFTVVSRTGGSGTFNGVGEGHLFVNFLGSGHDFQLTYQGEDGEDIVISGASDFGDAPAPYPTNLSDNGARHIAIGPRLGSLRDADTNGQPSANADGDDATGLADEDGVQFGVLQAGANMAAVNISLENAVLGKVDAWIDFNRNGIWESTEQILDSQEVTNDLQTLNFNLPSGLTPGDTVARVRLSSEGNLDPTGAAADGEVEDHLVTIITPPTVDEVIINAGQVQRSRVDRVTVKFDRIVDINQTGGDPFKFINTDTNDVVTDVVAISVSDARTVVDFTFAVGPSVSAGGGLIDGNYRLTIDASLVTYDSLELDGNGDGTAGDDYVFGTGGVDEFFRKYGDGDGNGTVELLDFASFRRTFGKQTGEPAYEAMFDADEDDMITLLDFATFRRNFGT